MNEIKHSSVRAPESVVILPCLPVPAQGYVYVSECRNVYTSLREAVCEKSLRRAGTQ